MSWKEKACVVCCNRQRPLPPTWWAAFFAQGLRALSTLWARLAVAYAVLCRINGHLGSLSLISRFVINSIREIRVDYWLGGAYLQLGDYTQAILHFWMCNYTTCGPPVINNYLPKLIKYFKNNCTTGLRMDFLIFKAPLAPCFLVAWSTTYINC